MTDPQSSKDIVARLRTPRTTVGPDVSPEEATNEIERTRAALHDAEERAKALHADVREWIAANGPGGWIDNLRKRSAHETSDEDAWLLVFADQDVKSELFTGHGAEDAARSRFEQAKASWTCRLFRSVASTGYCSPLETSREAQCGETVNINGVNWRCALPANHQDHDWQSEKAKGPPDLVEVMVGGAKLTVAVEPKSTAIPDCEPGCDCDFCHAPPVKASAPPQCANSPDGWHHWTGQGTSQGMCLHCKAPHPSNQRIGEEYGISWYRGPTVNGKGDSSD